MALTPIFPTQTHRETAELTKEYFLRFSAVDTILVVNSCARGDAVPESDLDMAILVKPGADAMEIKNIEAGWRLYSEGLPEIINYKNSTPSACLHVDVIDGRYEPGIMEKGGAPDYFEIEIGNQIRYSAFFGGSGSYFKELQLKWLPYYEEGLRIERLAMTKNACEYDLHHIPFYAKRGLYFHAFDRLYIAFQKLIQAVFISGKVYPISYTKWIRLQVEAWLGRPDLYAMLPSIISVSDIESHEVNQKVKLIKDLLLTI